MSVTSSLTPGMVENSCSTLLIRTAVIAKPGSEDNRMRRRRVADRDAVATLQRFGEEPPVGRGQFLFVELDCLRFD